jgi:hypothetical protein
VQKIVIARQFLEGLKHELAEPNRAPSAAMEAAQ